MKARHILSSLGPVLSLVLSGCGLGQFGGEVNSETDGGNGCEDLRSSELNPGDVAPAGTLKIDDLIELVSGDFQSSMAWGSGDATSSSDITLIPGAGDTSISVKIEVTEGSGKFVERAPVQTNGQEGNTLEDSIDGTCTNRLTVEAQVTVKSDNGAFDDVFLTTFWTEDGVVAQSQIPLAPGELEGSFDIDVSAIKNAKTIQTGLNLRLAFGNISGKVSGSIETRSKDAVSLSASQPYGIFPKDNPCENRVPVPAAAQLRTEVQTLFDENTEFAFKWTSDDESVPMQITTELDALCYEQASYGETPGYTATVVSKVVSEGANIDGNWALDAQVSVDDDGELSRVDVIRNSYMVLGVAPEEFAINSGISGITSDADQLSFTFGYGIDVADDHLASGELTVLALTTPECLTTPPAEEPGRNGSSQDGSPGCEGIHADEIKNAQFALASE